MVDEVALRQVSLRFLPFSPVNIIPPMLRTLLHLHVALTRNSNGCSLGTYHKAMLFRELGTTGWKSTFTFKKLAHKGFPSYATLTQNDYEVECISSYYQQASHLLKHVTFHLTQ